MEVICGLLKNCGVCFRNGCKYLIFENRTEGCFRANQQIPRVFKEFEHPDQCLSIPFVKVGEDFFEDLLEVLGGGIGGAVLAAILCKIYQRIINRPRNIQRQQQWQQGARILGWSLRLYREFRGNNEGENVPLVVNIELNAMELQNAQAPEIHAAAAVVVENAEMGDQQDQAGNNDDGELINLEQHNIPALDQAQINPLAPIQVDQPVNRSQQQPSRIPRLITPNPLSCVHPAALGATTARRHGSVNLGASSVARNTTPRNLFPQDQPAIINIEDPLEIGFRQRNSPARPQRAAAAEARNMMSQLRRDGMI